MQQRRPQTKPRFLSLRSLGTFLLKSTIAWLAIFGVAAIAGAAWAASSGDLTFWEHPGSEQVARAARSVGISTAVGENVSQERPVIYLNREGATLTSGTDDSSRNVSSVVGAAGLVQYEAAPFTGATRRWNDIVSCVQDRFEAYDVNVVDQRPIEGDYIMVMIGGRPGDLARATGHEGRAVSRLRGVAPMGRVPIDDAVVFVFSQSMSHDARVTCETAVQEVGHAFGLDHVLDCHDPMTHLASCGRRTFRDSDTPCGENEPRTCVSGQATQNSHRYLLDVLGPREASDGRVADSGNAAPRSARERNPSTPASRTPRAAARGGS